MLGKLLIDAMAEVEDFEELLNHPLDEGAQLHLSKGQPSVRNAGAKFTSFLARSASKENKAAIQEFKDALERRYGGDIAREAFAASGLDERLLEKKPGPLTVHRLQTALDTAALLKADLTHKETYAQREQKADEWKPTTKLSSLMEQGGEQPSYKGLRLHSMETAAENKPDRVQVHGWHPRNRDVTEFDQKSKNFSPELDEWHELDAAVRAEMNNLPELNDNPRAQNLQARLNLLNTMVTRAEGGATEGVAQVFVAPEWLFSGLEATDEITGERIAGGALTEKEMQKVTAALTDMSRAHPEMTIMAGTILWSKPSPELLQVDGKNVPVDMVFNCAPVLEGGELIHTAYKINQGFDPTLACKGMRQKSAYDLPDRSNGQTARLQVFMVDPKIPNELKKAVEPIQSKMKEMGAPGSEARAWENDLRVRPASPCNHLFETQGKTFAVDICADHGCAMAQEEVDSLGKNEGLAARIKNSPGVDVHLVVSAGASPQPRSCLTKPGGAYVVADMNEGVFVSAPIKDERNQVNNARLLGRKVECKRITSEEHPVSTGKAINQEHKHSESKSVKNDVPLRTSIH